MHPFDDRDELVRAALDGLVDRPEATAMIPLHPARRSPCSPAGRSHPDAGTAGDVVVDGPVVTDSREAAPG